MSTPPKPPRRKRRLIWGLGAAALLLAAGAAAWGPVVSWVVVSRVGAEVGGQASATGVSLNFFNGTLMIDGLTIRAPGIEGEAGEVFRAQRVQAKLSMASLVGSGQVLREVLVVRPRMRVSQSTIDSRVNVAHLTPTTGGSMPGGVPVISVTEGVLEIGEHAGEMYTSLQRYRVNGQIGASGTAVGGDGEALIILREDNGGGEITVRGRVSAESLTLTLAGLQLNRMPPEALPTPLRENYKRLALSGEITSTTLHYVFDGDLEIIFALADVGLNLPLPAGPEGAEGRLPRMSRVGGEIRLSANGALASLSGAIEDLPYDADFAIQGTGADAPFQLRVLFRDVQLTQHPEVLVFAPPGVRKRLTQFSNPTGIITADVTISRAEGEEHVSFRGAVSLREGTAAFNRVPYRFESLSLKATFDDKALRITDISGVAPSGAKITGEALIAPPTREAGVDVRLRVTDLPVDGEITKALGTRGKILTELLSAPAHASLRGQGLIATSTDHRLAREELAKVAGGDPHDETAAERWRAVLAAPVFELGGMSSVDIHVFSDVGVDTEWHDVITITLEHADVLVDEFPYPMRVRDVTLVKDDDSLTVRGGEYTGLTGARMNVAVEADISKLNQPGVRFIPTVEVDAEHIPLDALILAALPETGAITTDGRNLREVLDELSLSGAVRGAAMITQREDGGLGYQIDVSAAGVSARPRSGEGPGLALDEIHGLVEVSHERVQTALSMLVGSAAGEPGQRLGDCRIEADVDLTPVHGSGLTLTVTAKDADLALAIEDAAAAFTHEGREAIASLRERYGPTGPADIVFSLTQTPPSEAEGPSLISWSARATAIDGVELTLEGARVRVRADEGSLLFSGDSADDGVEALLEGWKAEYAAGADAAWTQVRLDGQVRRENEAWSLLSPLAVDVIGGRIECPLTHAAINTTGLEEIAAWLRESLVTGVSDAEIVLPGPDDGPEAMRLSLRPRALGLTRRGTAVAFQVETGEVIVEPGGSGHARGLRVRAPEWTAQSDITWMPGTQAGTTAASATLAAQANGFPDDLKALLPPDLAKTLDDLKVRVSGPLEVRGVNLSLVMPAGGEVGAFTVSGDLSVQDAATDVGVELTQAKASLTFEAQRAAIGERPTFDVRVLAPSLHAAGVRLTDARARIMAPADADVQVPHFSADCHGGRISGSASITPSLGTQPVRYEVNTQGSNIRFASVIADLRQPLPADAASPPTNDEEPDESRGVMDFGLTLSGTVDDSASRRGRGTARVAGGRVLNMPLVITLVKVSNLQLPISERLDYAQADFFVQGTRVELERAWISSPGVDIYGFGTAAWPGMELDMRFRTKARNRIPLVSGVLENIRNELVTAIVQGTLMEPEVNVQSFGRTTQFMKNLFGGEQSEQERRLEQIEKMAERDRRPSRPQQSGAADASRDD
jgi:hypothetical protein